MQKGKEDSISFAGTGGKCTLFQCVTGWAVFVGSRDQELLGRVVHWECPKRKILLFSVKEQ